MKNIAAALVKAQKAFAPALKTNTNPHFKSRYADLSACVEAVIDALNANGIFLSQVTHEDATGVTVETVFVHESGETFSSGKLHVPASKQDPQGYGSALTYARRYSLMAGCGIAPEDDDGNAASKPSKAPVAAVMQEINVSEEDMEWLKTIAADLVEMVEGQGNQAKAYDYLEQQRLDNDQKVALWDILKTNSKTRSAIKKEGDARRNQPKEQQ